MSASNVSIGSPGYWALMRLAQVLMVGMGLLFAFIAGWSFQWDLLIILLWFLFVIYLDTSVYGYADEDGVHFRRYISMQFVPWTDIGRVSWFGKYILSIHLKAGNFLRRELNANSSSSRSIFYNVEEEPDLVRWLGVAKPPAADGIELAPWGSEMASSPKMRMVVQILVPIFSAALLVWFLVTIKSAHR